MRAVILSPVLVSFLALTGCIIYIGGGPGGDCDEWDDCGRDECDEWDDCDRESEDCDDDWEDDWEDDWVDENGNGIPDHLEEPDEDPEGDPDQCQRAFDVSVGYETESTGWIAGTWDAGWHGMGWLEGQWSQELGEQALVTGAWGSAEGELVGELEGWIFEEEGTLWLTGWAWSEADLVYLQAPLEETEEGAWGAGWWSFAEAWLEGSIQSTGAWTAEGLHLDFPAHAEGEFLGDCDEDSTGAITGHYMADNPEALVDGPIEGAWYEWEAGVSWGWDFGVAEWGWFFGSSEASEDSTRSMGGDGFPYSCQ